MTEIIFTCAASGADYTLPSLWDDDVECNLTASTTKIYSHGGITGTLASGDSLEVNGDAASTATIAGITSTQVLLVSISGTIEDTDVLQKVGATSNNITLSSGASSTNIAVLELANENFDDDVNLTGFTTDSSNYVIMRPQSGAEHDGTPGSGARMVTTPGTSTPVVRTENYCQIIGLELESQQSSGSSAAIQCDPDSVVQNCILKTASGNRAIYYGSRSSFESCLVYECGGQAFEPNGTGISNAEVLGCTIVDCGGWAIQLNSSCSIKVAGTVSYNNTSGFWNGTATINAGSDYNATDGTGFTDVPGGDTGNNIDQLSATATDVFEAPSSDDYSPASGSSLLDAWSASPDVTTDAIGTSRPQDSTADIGFIEDVGGGGGGSAKNFIYYSQQA